MRDYSPKRRTALVFAGSGSSGAYHAGALRALDESGVKIDLVVGSGVGVVAAAFAAVGGGARLHGPDGFWTGVGWGAFYRVRPVLRLALSLLAVSFAVFALPVLLGLLLGMAFPLLLIADRVLPGAASRVLAALWVTPEALSGPYLAAQAVPVFALAMLAIAVAAAALARDRRRFAEAFESLLDSRPGLERLKRSLWGVARGPALSGAVPGERELGRRYVALLAENLGEPGFRELVLRTADLDRGSALAFTVLRGEGEDAPAGGAGALGGAVDLRAEGHDALLFDALATGLLCPTATELRRITFPRGSALAGETHRLTDATLAGGSGVEEALAAGAEQVVVVTGVPEGADPPVRRRGPLARLDAVARTLERRVSEEIEWAGAGAGVDVWVVRPRKRALGPMELDGSSDPATEVRQTTEDLVELGYRDAYRQFVEPVVGQSPLPQREEGKYRDTQPVGL